MSSGHVVINGKKYSLAAGAKPSSVKPIDGFTGTTSKAHSPRTKLENAKKALRTSKTTEKRSTSANKSQTLSRKAVKKPSTVRTRTAAPVITRPSLNAPKKRLESAASSVRSPMIGKYTGGQATVELKHANISPKPEPSAPNTSPPVVKPQQVQIETLFSRHVDNATPISAAKTKKKRAFKAHAVVPVIVFSLFAGGLLAYTNLPRLSVRIASARAGFSAGLPDSPSGFSVAGPIKYEAGKVAVAYESNTDDRFVNLFQQPSDLDSASLSSGFLDTKGIEYETREIAGKTVFIYEGSKATWVSKGVWYNLEGESKLSSDQILQLADSL